MPVRIEMLDENDQVISTTDFGDNLPTMTYQDCIIPLSQLPPSLPIPRTARAYLQKFNHGYPNLLIPFDGGDLSYVHPLLNVGPELGPFQGTLRRSYLLRVDISAAVGRAGYENILMNSQRVDPWTRPSVNPNASPVYQFTSAPTTIFEAHLANQSKQYIEALVLNPDYGTPNEPERRQARIYISTTLPASNSPAP